MRWANNQKWKKNKRINNAQHSSCNLNNRSPFILDTVKKIVIWLDSLKSGQSSTHNIYDDWNNYSIRSNWSGSFKLDSPRLFTIICKNYNNWTSPWCLLFEVHSYDIKLLCWSNVSLMNELKIFCFTIVIIMTYEPNKRHS